MRIAGQGQRTAEPVLHVDYADLIREAVEVEHWKTLRAVVEAVESVDVNVLDRYDQYRSKDRGGSTVKTDILARIKAMAR